MSIVAAQPETVDTPADLAQDIDTRREVTRTMAACFDPEKFVEARLIYPGGKRKTLQVWRKAVEWPDHVDELKRWNDAGYGIYFGANPRPDDGVCGDANIEEALVVIVDMDDITVDAALARWYECGLPEPTMIVSTGGGVQIIIRLAVPMTDWTAWRELHEDLIAVLGSDDSVKNPERVMRLPGFKNTKEKYGAPSPIAHIVRCDATRRIAFDELRELVPPRQKPQPAAVVNRSADRLKIGPDAYERCRKYVDKMPISVAGDHGHNKCFHVATTCFRFGLSAGETRSILNEFSGRCDPPWSAKEIEHKIAQAHKIVAAKGEIGSMLKNGNGNLSQYTGGNGHNGKHVEAANDDAPDAMEFPEPIPLDARTLPSLPEGIFIGTAGDFIYANARATETPPEFGAATLLAVVATAVQKRVSVMVEPGYFEQLSIFTVPTMEVGTRKTSAQARFPEPLLEFEERQVAAVAAEIKKAKSERKTAEARIAKLRTLAAKAKPEDYEAQKAEIEKLEAELPAVPAVPQLISQDITSENLATLMEMNGERMGIFSDEGGIFETIAGRYSAGVPNIDIFLKGHAGSFVRVNRGTRDPVMLHHPALSMSIAVQPEVIKGLADKPSFRGRGLIGRCLYFVPDAKIGYRKHETTPIPDAILEAYRYMITALLELPPRTDANGKIIPHVLKLEKTAHAAWKAFQHQIEEHLRPGGRLEHARDWGNKLPGAVARIAGILHCCEFASDPTSQGEISADTMNRAILLGEFLIEHALAAFDLMGASSGREIARQLWAVLKSTAADRAKRHADGSRREPADVVSLRDMWHPLRNSYPSTADVEPGVRTLIDHGHVIELPSADYGKPGRRRRFKLNPKLCPPSGLIGLSGLNTTFNLENE